MTEMKATGLCVETGETKTMAKKKEPKGETKTMEKKEPKKRGGVPGPTVTADDAFVAGEVAKWRTIYPIVSATTKCSGCPRALGQTPMICPCGKAYFCLKCRHKRTKAHVLCQSTKIPATIVTPPLEVIPAPHTGELKLGPELGDVSVPVRLIAHQYLPRAGKRGTVYYLANGVAVLQASDPKAPAVVQLPKSAAFLAEQTAFLEAAEKILARTALLRRLLLQALQKADPGYDYSSLPATVPGIWNYDAYCAKRCFAVCLRGAEYRDVLPIFHPRGAEDLKAYQDHAQAQAAYALQQGLLLVEVSTEAKNPGQLVLDALKAHLARIPAPESLPGAEEKGGEDEKIAKEEDKEEEAEKGADNGGEGDSGDEGYEEGQAEGEDTALMGTLQESPDSALAQSMEAVPLTAEEQAARDQLAQYATAHVAQQLA